MTRLYLFVLLLSSLALLLAPQDARAARGYDNCTGFITSVPAVITTQGTWCLKQDLSTALTSGNAIAINTNNVTIDCNDFKLGGLAAGINTGVNGIYAKDRFNLTVRHCAIRGFFIGLFFDSTNGSSGGSHTVEDNRAEGNTLVGIEVHGDGSVIRRNLSSNSGGTPYTASAYGIAAVNSVDILDNTVSDVTASAGADGFAYGIYTAANANGRINGNGIRGLTADGVGKIYGILNTTSDAIVVRDNEVIGNTSPGSVGIYCETSSGSLKGNVITGFATGKMLCTNSGNNDISP